MFESGDIDTSLVVLKFANGVIGTISNSRKATYGYDQVRHIASRCIAQESIGLSQ